MMSGPRFAAAVCLAAGVSLFAPVVSYASDPERVEWSPDWPKFRKAEIAATSGMAVQMGIAFFVLPEPHIRWEGGMLFDDAVRSALVIHNRKDRDAAATWSDNIYY